MYLIQSACFKFLKVQGAETRRSISHHELVLWSSDRSQSSRLGQSRREHGEVVFLEQHQDRFATLGIYNCCPVDNLPNTSAMSLYHDMVQRSVRGATDLGRETSAVRDCRWLKLKESLRRLTGPLSFKGKVYASPDWRWLSATKGAFNEGLATWLTLGAP